MCDTYDFTLILAPKWDVQAPSVATGYLCRYLRSQEFRVQYLDFNIRAFHECQQLGYGHFWTDSIYHQGWLKGDFRFLSAFFDLDEVKGDVVGISFTATNRQLSMWIARIIRERYPTKKIILGGYALFFEEDLRDIPVTLADAICKGEGEQTLVQVLKQDFQHLEEIPGLYLPEGDRWQLSRERDSYANLDDIPWPDYAEVDMQRYTLSNMAVVGSRGCISRCNFCNDRWRFPGFRSRSAQHQVDELEYLKQQFNVPFFIYNDSLMNGDLHVMEERAAEIIRRGLDVDYGGNMMVHPKISAETLSALRKSGQTLAIVGVESGSAKTLAGMRKRHNPQQAAAFLQKCHNAGMRVELNLIVGFPTETEKDFQDTLCFLKDNRDVIDVLVSVTTFGIVQSDLWHCLDEYGIVRDDTISTVEWHTKDGRNTLEVRLDRQKRLIDAAADFGITTMTTDQDTEKVPPFAAHDFLRAYAQKIYRQEGASEAERSMMNERKRTIRREVRRIQAKHFLSRVGLLEQALWIKRKFL